MSKFNKGDKIINVLTNEIGYIIEVYPPRRGRQLYKVKYDDRENDENSVNLLPNIDLTDPFERASENYYDHYSEYLKGNTAFKIRSSNNSTISSLKASRTLFRPYQFKPLLKFLNSDNRRLLIADEVGLGKTIEAGHIMLELKARGEFHNALVICPMALMAKWTTELNEKFGLDFIEISQKDLLIHELQNHNGYVRAVVNYDKIRDTSDILKVIEEKNIKFSIIICDESHKLRNSSTMIYRGAERLLYSSDSVVFMSATPIMINENNLYNQLHLLDAEMYDNPEVFRNNIQLNRPFVRALTQLNNGVSLPMIAEELSMSEVITYNSINDTENIRKFVIDEYFKDYPIYQEIKTLMNGGVDNHAIRAQLQYDLSEMSPMNTIFSRTRKNEVTKDWSQAVRNPYTHRISLIEEEHEAYEMAIKEYIGANTAIDENGYSFVNSLGLVTIKRQLASSVWAYLNKVEDLDQGIDSYSDKVDTKFQQLLKILETVFANGNKKIIIFAIFKKTLKYLSIRLQKVGYKCALIYGDSTIDKTEMLRQFQFDDSYKVLLSSEVGSEGLDMQFCNTIVNYDLPWNPMVVEQRIGRIDRFGQESPKININTIVVTDSILEDIYERLLMRIGIFRESIGDLEAILDSEIKLEDGRKITIQDALKNIERDYYSDKLTQEEVVRKENKIAQAIENEKLNLKRIEEGLTNALTNDSYFRNEINKIVNDNAYVTSHELLQFVLQIIKEHLTTCDLVPSGKPDIYVFRIPPSSSRVLRGFLERYQPADNDGKKLFRKYLTQIEDKTELEMTFNQELAFKDKSLTYINIYHPIVLAGVRLFEETRDNSKRTFFFEMESCHLPAEINKGRYMLAIYKIRVSRNVYDRAMLTDSLYPMLFDIANDCLIENQNLAERFMGCAQIHGHYAPLDSSYKLGKDTIAGLRYDFNECIDRYVHKYQRDLQIRIDNNKKLRNQQTIQYYESRQKNFERIISDYEMERDYALMVNDEKAVKRAESVLRLNRANLRDLLEKKKLDIERINRDVQLKVKYEIESLNLVNIV